MTAFWESVVIEALRGVGMKLGQVLPNLAMTVVLLVLGLLIGGVVKIVLRRLLRAFRFDQRCQGWGITQAVRRAGIGREPADIVSLVTFWGIFVIFATMAVDLLWRPQDAGAAGVLVMFLPHLFAAVLILVIGWLLANFLAQGVLIASVNSGIPEARLLARAVRWGVLLFTFATALTQLGIGKEMVLIAFGITFGGLIFALALAFGLGGRRLAREILERRLRRGREPHPSETLSHL
ncbi:MAG TPA: hypothetical protein VJO34_00650 [Methylomirabilota bacterium]|nr:hypothetical protein [Methylomirabilota bacterium]